MTSLSYTGCLLNVLDTVTLSNGLTVNEDSDSLPADDGLATDDRNGSVGKEVADVAEDGLLSTQVIRRLERCFDLEDDGPERKQ
jgi:hypothetical protein